MTGQIHVIAGNRGEVGSALQTVLKKLEERGGDAVWGFDKDDQPNLTAADFLHVCYPWDSDRAFYVVVRDHIRRCGIKDGIVVVHSTVPVGTCSAIDENVVHSPIRGIHPNLDLGIQIFTKFFGGPRAEEAAEPFRKLGIKCVTTPKPENTEALKLWDTTQHGVAIVVEKAIHEYCERHGLDFDLVHTAANETYNSGYHALNCDHFCRPVLKHVPGPIGGHCVIQNAEMLDNFLPRWLLQMNKVEKSIFDLE